MEYSASHKNTDVNCSCEHFSSRIVRFCGPLQVRACAFNPAELITQSLFALLFGIGFYSHADFGQNTIRYFDSIAFCSWKRRTREPISHLPIPIARLKRLAEFSIEACFGG
jgi:hypothetical protein